MVRCARSSPHPQECDLVPSEAVPDLQRLVVCSASAATCSDPARELRGRAGRVGLTGCTTAREATTAAAVRAAAATASETATRAHCSEGRVGSLGAGRSWEGSEGSSEACLFELEDRTRHLLALCRGRVLECCGYLLSSQRMARTASNTPRGVVAD